MPEFIKYKNKPVKIGTLECLYYTSFYKYKSAFDGGHLKWDEGSAFPAQYLNPQFGFMFRFPFPDEDKLRLGEIIEPFNREIPISVSKATYDQIMEGDHNLKDYQLSVVFQKPVNRESDGKLCHALVFRDCAAGGLYRIEDDREVNLLVKDIVKHHISNETDATAKSFYRTVAARVLKGYRLDRSREIIQSANKIDNTSLASVNKQADKPGAIKANEKTGRMLKRIRKGKSLK